MAVIHFTYRVELEIDDKDILKLTEFLAKVEELNGTAKLLKTQSAKED